MLLRKNAHFRFQKCPQCLKHYGFCGILAIIYAARLVMPKSQKQLALFFEIIKGILVMPINKWVLSRKENRGAINSDHILTILKALKCRHKVVRFKRSGKSFCLRKWIKQKSIHRKNSFYIVNVTGHHVFVHFHTGCEKWQIYDQSGICDKYATDKQKKSCCLGNKILCIIKIL